MDTTTRCDFRACARCGWTHRLTIAACCLAGTIGLALSGSVRGDEIAADQEFVRRVSPVLRTYCLECHTGESAEAEIDFAAILAEPAADVPIDVWLRTRTMLDSRQMPPRDARQLDAEQRALFEESLAAFLRRKAEAHAGDPGLVTLRRLTNAEYSYAIQDLTGLSGVDPTAEFPVDGAAGEGFTNVGDAQSMSPALVQKYLQAARSVADHVVLLPGTIGFSEHTTRRDRTDDLLRRIREFYARYTDAEGGSAVDLQGIRFDTNQGGRLPLRSYLTALRTHRSALQSGDVTADELAEQTGLSARYLRRLERSLADPEFPASSPFLAELRQLWQQDDAEFELDAFLAEITAVQAALWKFNTIGHIGRAGGPTSWMEPMTPVEQSAEFRVPLERSGEDTRLWLSAHDFHDGNESDHVEWQRPRIVFPEATGQPPLLLSEAVAAVRATRSRQRQDVARTADYLNALANLGAATSDGASADEIARAEQLDPDLLRRWARLTGVGLSSRPVLTGHFSDRLTAVSGYADVNGWGRNETPSLLTNRSDEEIRFLTLGVPARGVTVHPSPALEAWAAWQAPAAGRVSIVAVAADADDQCGNGAAWRVELWTDAGIRELGAGVFDNGGRVEFRSAEPLDVRPGDIVKLAVGPRDGSHACDTTHIELTITAAAESAPSPAASWKLSEDIVDRIHDANPLGDRHGNAAVWHFGAGESSPQSADPIPADSVLARWVAAVHGGASDEERRRLAARVTQLLLAANSNDLTAADDRLRTMLLDWTGPLNWLSSGREAAARADAIASEDPGTETAFGEGPSDIAIDATSLYSHAPSLTPVTIPAELSGGTEFVVTGRVARPGSAGSVQLNVSRQRPPQPPLTAAAPVVVAADSPLAEDVEVAFAEVRNLFPPAVCYARIVPVDEVVTLQLFYREDELLQRLLLNETEIAELNRLWDELLYVSREPIALTVSFEQLTEFATQDRPDLVKAFASAREPIHERAERFRQRLRNDEPAQVDAVMELADRAWRRPVTAAESAALRGLYHELREAGVVHEDAVPLLVTRVLASPAFLYRREQPVAGRLVGPVSDDELATRLSFFLWSSIPDDELRQTADEGTLAAADDSGSDAGVLRQQALRMLADPRTRRLAEQFACQWLHVRDFDQRNDKNEALYPEFPGLRESMYEETVRFFEDLFRSNGSILDLLTADHTWLNQALAEHYGIPGVSGSEWRKVENLQDSGRGGILGMATILASQSGASRTSPILRGNWISETLLGERLPRPPANVPQLPDTVPSGLTARELIERHSSVPECAGCHRRIDPYGFALEQFDTIGRRRPMSVDTRTTLPDGTPVDGLDGLRRYLAETRRDAIVSQFCRKLLGYALGRSVQLSDEPLLDRMQTALAQDGYRVHTAVELIVTSPQFRQIRGTQWSEDR